MLVEVVVEVILQQHQVEQVEVELEDKEMELLGQMVLLIRVVEVEELLVLVLLLPAEMEVQE
jgi:hypothetical protein